MIPLAFWALCAAIALCVPHIRRMQPWDLALTLAFAWLLVPAFFVGFYIIGVSGLVLKGGEDNA